MKKFKVTFEVHIDKDHRAVRSFIIEAGNKKTAYTRGLVEMSKIKEWANYYKSIIEVSEVKEDGR